MIGQGIREGVRLLLSLDPEVWEPIGVSLEVCLASTLLSMIIALPLAMALGHARLRWMGLLDTLLGTLMALPTVLVGLVVYALISRSGPLGELGLLYSRTAMVIGQAILAVPIILGLSLAAVRQADPRIRMTALALGAGRWRAAIMVAVQTRTTLLAAVAAGFGRVFAEVGISMMLGGNIRGQTRSITTGIAFETGKGEFARGVALGLVLLTVALGVNLLVGLLRSREAEHGLS